MREHQNHPPSQPERGAENVTVHENRGGDKPVRRPFPGPRGAAAALRVALDRQAYGDLIAHAKEGLEVEVCGVLAGQVAVDEEGIFVHVEATIRGTAASQASTHVTFTQATWNLIHQTLDRDYPQLRIVGWYHTHPGFGVEFSEMDVFIQRNFFPGSSQIGLVLDPLSGAVAVCFNAGKEIEYLERFWIEGREHPARVPPRPSSKPGGDLAASGPATSTAATLQALESRMSQLVQALDDQRASFHRFLLVCGAVFCLAVITATGYFLYRTWSSRYEPPRLNSYVPIPVQIGDRVVLLGVGVAEWRVPDDLNATLVRLEQLRREAEAKANRDALKQLATNTADGATNLPTPPGSSLPQPPNPAQR